MAATGTLPNLSREPSIADQDWSCNSVTRSVKRFACDRCHVQKLKCPRQSGSDDPCLRCVKVGQASTCVYSPTLRMGRPLDVTGNQRARSSRQKTPADYQNLLLGRELPQMSDVGAQHERAQPTADSGDEGSRTHVQILAPPAEGLNFDHGTESTNWSWTPTQPPLAFDADSNSLDLMESPNTSSLQQDDSLSGSGTVSTTGPDLNMDLHQSFPGQTLSKPPPPPHTSPASDNSIISSVEACLTRLTELHVSLFQGNQMLSSSSSPRGRRHSRGIPSPVSASPFTSLVDLSSIFAAAEQLIDCIRFLTFNPVSQLISAPLALSPASASVPPAAHSDHSSSSSSTSVSDGQFSEEVICTQMPDSATVFLVLSCYTRLIGIFTKIVERLKTGTVNMDSRDLLGSVQIGSFDIPPSSDLQIIITLQVVSHLFQRVNHVIRLYTTRYDKDDSVLVQDLRFAEWKLKEEIKHIKQRLRSSTNL